MTERRALYLEPTYGYNIEQDITSDTFTFYGVAIGAGDLAMGNNRITGVPDTPTAGGDAVNQNYVDSKITGLKWVEPCEVLGLVGNLAVASLNALGASAGDAYVVTDSGTLTRGSVAVTAGDLVEDDGTNWVLVVPDSGGFVPADTRAILSTTTALVSPYTDATDDGKIVEFSGSSNTGTDTSEATDEAACLISGDGSYYEYNGYVFEGAVPTGSWIQFTGAGQINAGAGLLKSGNTLSVRFGDGIKEVSDYVTVDLATNPGLEFTGGGTPDDQLRVQTVAAGGIQRAATGIEILIDDTPDTLDVDASGLKVSGLPSGFKVNDVATNGTYVTAANLDTLNDGSNADALHTHATAEAGTVENTFVNNEAITTGRAVYFAANDEVGHADNAAGGAPYVKARAIGVARTGGAIDPGTSEIVSMGPCASALSGATVNTPYWLGASGALVVFGSIPLPGRVIRMGVAKNATDLWVDIQDRGWKAA